MTREKPTRLHFVGGLYDRLVPLYSGEVGVEGFDLRFDALDSPREVFDLMVQTSRYDAAEMSFAEHVAATARGKSPFVALPVVISRVFRHGFIFVNRLKGIEKPTDLAGKRIGVPLYTQSAAVWIRGILKSEYGVDLSDVQWVEGALNQAGRYGVERPIELLKPINVGLAPPDKSLSAMLADGELDAVLGAQVPDCLHRIPHVQRLFPDFRVREKEFFLRTGVFPIMHLLVLRREFVNRNPAAGQAFFDAMCRAKSLATRKMRDTSAPRYMLPWLVSDLEEIDEVFGPDHWPYGVEANRRTLETFIDYMVDQNMIGAPVSVEELFLPVRERDPAN